MPAKQNGGPGEKQGEYQGEDNVNSVSTARFICECKRSYLCIQMSWNGLNNDLANKHSSWGIETFDTSKITLSIPSSEAYPRQIS